MEKSSVIKGLGTWAKTNVLNEIGVTSPLWGVANAFCILASAAPDAACAVLAKVRPDFATVVGILASEHFDEIVKAYRESLVEHPLQFKLRTETKLDGTQVYKTFYFRPENLDKLVEAIRKTDAPASAASPAAAS